ncbi:hypothetical protein [Ornithinimicrobium tianjinense]|uniref:Transcriptional regulator, AbiEi antitoxin, Type IV TA system n=1 Tax=Ornithinimicrobium tianjinense TaxID=1195761 RepID=A0A917F571_9MICO|nr:hypothetical protein [Ornithinimicrobium tianjinense]GGF47813.1 hypothetical protein GCM10011366_14510 [Ornithinimicrobium tianjinense]
MSEQRLFPAIAGQHDLATSFQLREAGWSADAIRHARDRTIQEVVPRVFASHRGPLTVEQRLVGAHLWAGEAAVLTGRVALDRHGLTVPSLGTCVFLVPSTRRARATAGVRTVRTTRPIQVAAHKDDVPVTSVARALCDAAALQELTGTELRATALSALQRRLTHPDRIEDELRMRPATNLGPVRSAVAEFADGVWSVPEGSLATLVRSDPTLPRYVLNPRLHAADGTLIGCPDGYFPTAGVVQGVPQRRGRAGGKTAGAPPWRRTHGMSSTASWSSPSPRPASPSDRRRCSPASGASSTPTMGAT